jgi:hypothetical protein
MDVLKTRIELKRMSIGDLFRLALDRRMSYCLIGRRPCGFLLQYKGSNFCVSEILREGCQVEGQEQLEHYRDEKGEVNLSLSFPHKMETGHLLPWKGAMVFRIYHRDNLTHTAVFLGKIIERRRKERGDNLKSLLSKAIEQYSDQLEDPSTIFLCE